MNKDERAELNHKRKQELVEFLHTTIATAKAKGFSCVMGVSCQETGVFSTEMYGHTIALTGLVKALDTDITEHLRESCAVDV